MMLPKDFDVQALHDLVAGMHQGYYDMGGPETQIDMMLCLVVEGRVGFVPLGAESRDEWYAKAAVVVAGLDPAMYCVASEAWMAVAAKPDDPASALPPSKRNDRREVVATVAVGRDGAKASSVKIIDRHEAGKRVGRVRSLTDRGGLDMADGDMFRIFQMADLV